MKIIDCFMYYDEDNLLDLRLNILNKYVDKFIIVESKFTHSGNLKNKNFDLENFKEFKNKIDYYFIENEPLNLKKGDYAILNTSIFKHGDLLNKTGQTRFSMDFRFIPTIHLRDQKISLTKGVMFSTNSYFINERDILELN